MPNLGDLLRDDRLQLEDDFLQDLIEVLLREVAEFALDGLDDLGHQGFQDLLDERVMAGLVVVNLGQHRLRQLDPETGVHSL